MANLVVAPLVNTKLYRHFAAVTFSITLCVALFANGEARQVVGDTVTEQAEAAKLRDAQTKKFGVRRIGDHRMKVNASQGFGEEFDSTYGNGNRTSSSGPDTRSTAGSFAGNAEEIDLPGANAPKALSPDEMTKLSPEQQTAYIKQLRSQGTPEAEKDVLDIASITAGSRARSGSRSND